MVFDNYFAFKMAMWMVMKEKRDCNIKYNVLFRLLFLVPVWDASSVRPKIICF